MDAWTRRTSRSQARGTPSSGRGGLTRPDDRGPLRGAPGGARRKRQRIGEAGDAGRPAAPHRSTPSPRPPLPRRAYPPSSVSIPKLATKPRRLPVTQHQPGPAAAVQRPALAAQGWGGWGSPRWLGRAAGRRRRVCAREKWLYISYTLARRCSDMLRRSHAAPVRLGVGTPGGPSAQWIRNSHSEPHDGLKCDAAGDAIERAPGVRLRMGFVHACLVRATNNV